VVGCPFLYQRTSSFAVGNVMETSPETLKENLERFRHVVEANMQRLLDSTPECRDCP